jgi:hypothetical protein
MTFLYQVQNSDILTTPTGYGIVSVATVVTDVFQINWFSVDEPHGSLFMYFRIFAPLADYHVIASHVTSLTRPIPTFSDQLRSFPLICDDFRSFPMIFTFGRHLASIANPDWVPCNTAEVLQFSKTVAKDTSMSVYQNSEATSAYRFGPVIRRYREGHAIAEQVI